MRHLIEIAIPVMILIGVAAFYFSLSRSWFLIPVERRRPGMASREVGDKIIISTTKID